MPFKKRASPWSEAAAKFRLARYSAPYRSRLLAGLNSLQGFCQDHVGTRLSDAILEPAGADATLAAYILWAHDQKATIPLYVAKHALLGAQIVNPALKRQLPTAWSNLQTWEEERVHRLRPPLPIPIWCCLLGLARAHASSTTAAEATEWWTFAVLVEIGLLCLLRPGELFKLSWGDISLPGSLSFGHSHAAIKIEAPKNRRQFGASQFVSLVHPGAIAWLEKLRVGQGNSNKIWPRSRSHFGKRFKQLLSELQLTDCRFTMSSLRPGGATFLFGRGVPISAIRFTGRWCVERTLEHYLQLATATQITTEIPEEISARLIKIARHCLCLLKLSGNPSRAQTRLLTSKDLVKAAVAYAEEGCDFRK